MMKRTLYPYSTRDRYVFWASLFNTAWPILAWLSGDYWIAGFGLLCAVLGFLSVYVLQDQRTDVDGSAEYAAMVTRVADVATELRSVGLFLAAQQRRMADSEAALTQFKDEKEALDPVVLTQKETVEAILSAHAARTARSAWKERLIGFALGILASIVASAIYAYFQK